MKTYESNVKQLESLHVNKGKARRVSAKREILSV